MKITLNSTNGETTAANFDVFLTVKSTLDVNGNRLVISFNQSKEVSPKIPDSIDYIGLKRSAIVIENPKLTTSISSFQTYCNNELKKFIESLALPNIVSIV